MPNPRRTILLVEDDEAHAKLISRAFAQSDIPLDLTVVRTMNEALRQIAAAPPDLVLADMRLPDGSGVDLLRVGESGGDSYPVIVMTNFGTEQTAVDAIKAGALDYVVKSETVFAEMPRVVARGLREWSHIVEKQEIERQLRENETRLRLLTEQVPAMMWTLDRELRFTSSRGAGLGALGMKRDQVVGMRLQDYLQNEDPEFPPLAIHLAALQGYSRKTDAVWENNYYEARTEPLRNERGEIIGCIGMAMDITDRVKAERALRESEQRYRLLMDSASDAIFIADATVGMLVDANQRAQQLTGRSLERLRRMHRSELHPSADSDRVNRLVEQLDREQSVTGELMIVHRDGHLIPVEISMSIISVGNQQLIQSIARDLTERKRTETKLRESEAQIAHVTRLSTLGEMVAAIAHEINQPLYAISNFAVACRETLESAEELPIQQIRAWNHDIIEAASRAGDIIKRLREFVRKGHPSVRQVDLHQLIRDTLLLLEPETLRNDVHVVTQFDAANPTVAVDPVQIQQVLVNLIRNACEAIQATQQHGAIRIVTEDQDAAIQFSVEDEGPGLEPKELDQVFEPFFTTKSEGMGMGLAISRTIIESHRGQIEACNHAAGGAAFRITLPRWD